MESSALVSSADDGHGDHHQSSIDPSMSAAPVEDISPVDLPPWIAVSDVAALRVVARVRVPLERESSAAPTAPPRLMLYFSRRTFSSAEHVDSAISEPFHLIMRDPSWEGEARSVFMRAVADYMPPADGALLAHALCMYTSSIVGLLPTTDGILMEISSFILISNNSSPIDHLQLALPSEDFILLDVDDPHSSGGPRPASDTAVQGLKMVSGVEEGSCPICLEDFMVAALVLAMPCGHLFHETCLKEWLGRSHSCPLCRFPLPDAE